MSVAGGFVCCLLLLVSVAVACDVSGRRIAASFNRVFAVRVSRVESTRPTFERTPVPVSVKLLRRAQLDSRQWQKKKKASSSHLTLEESRERLDSSKGI